MKVELERAVVIQGMQENRILAIMPKYGNLAPGPQKMNFFGNFYGKVSEFRFQRALNHPQTDLNLMSGVVEGSLEAKFRYLSIKIKNCRKIHFLGAWGRISIFGHNS